MKALLLLILPTYVKTSADKRDIFNFSAPALFLLILAKAGIHFLIILK
jgi:hypothetical protein